jgi:hypothetical protein
LRALRAIVIVLGVLIVLGFGGLVAAVGMRFANMRAPAAPRFFADAKVTLPHEAVVLSGEVSGDRYVLHLGLPSGDRQLVVIDLATGAVLGRIDLVPEH